VSTTKIGPKHQITIPKDVFEALRLDVGDILEAEVESGKIVLAPKQLTEKAPVPKLTPKEHKLLLRARQKIEKIRKDMPSSRGLTEEEADVAAKAGLIDPSQRWWWTEEWQKGEREAESEIRRGRTTGPFSTADELLAHLHQSARRKRL
jgi:AbrB family looped-hinge helix DNA binding protein